MLHYCAKKRSSTRVSYCHFTTQFTVVKSHFRTYLAAQHLKTMKKILNKQKT